MVLSSSVSFFKKLKKNNNRDWFAENKPKFKELELEIKAFGEELKDRLNEFDNVDRFKLFIFSSLCAFFGNNFALSNPCSDHVLRAFTQSGRRLFKCILLPLDGP